MENIIGTIGVIIPLGIPFGLHTFFEYANPILTGISIMVGIAVGVTIFIRNIRANRKAKQKE